MATQRKIFGRIPTYRGDWSEGVPVKEKFRFTYRGSEFQALRDGLTTPPLNENDELNEGWQTISNGTDAYKSGQKLSYFSEAISSEFIEIILDAENKILAGINKDGDIIISCDLISTSNRTLIDKEISQSLSMSNSEEFLYALLDSQCRIIGGIDKEGNLNVGANIYASNIKQIESELVEVKNLLRKSYLLQDKTIAFYGDSITGQYRRDKQGKNAETLEFPFGNITWRNWEGWQSIVARYFRFRKCYLRGCGSQGFLWRSGIPGKDGGDLIFAYPDTGTTYNYASNEEPGTKWTYEDYLEGRISPPDGTVAMRGCYASWSRITTTFPVSIKDEIDIVFIMGGTNDGYTNEDVTFIEGDTTDKEWSASEFYDIYGGDYNLNTLSGSVASTIMKMQVWMPNATIIIASPLNGRSGPKGNSYPNMGISPEYAKSKIILDAANKLGVPTVDIFGTCCINGLNRTSYIYVQIGESGTKTPDSVHPFNINGQKALANAVISGINHLLTKNYII